MSLDTYLEKLESIKTALRKKVKNEIPKELDALINEARHTGMYPIRSKKMRHFSKFVNRLQKDPKFAAQFELHLKASKSN